MKLTLGYKLQCLLSAVALLLSMVVSVAANAHALNMLSQTADEMASCHEMIGDMSSMPASTDVGLEPGQCCDSNCACSLTGCQSPSVLSFETKVSFSLQSTESLFVATHYQNPSFPTLTPPPIF